MFSRLNGSCFPQNKVSVDQLIKSGFLSGIFAVLEAVRYAVEKRRTAAALRRGVTAWPMPGDPRLPRLAGKGRWHTEGWIGAILLGTDCVLAGRGRAQAARVGQFLESAIPAAVTLLA